MNLDERSNHFIVVIQSFINEQNRYLCSDFIYSRLSGYSTKFYFIEHKNDIKEDGSVKTAHYHIVLDFVRTRKRVATVLKDLSKLLVIPLNTISIEVAINLRSSVRYLIHFDDKKKFQYDFESIITNDKETLSFYFSSSDTLTFEYLQKVFDIATTTTDVIALIGVKTYNTYHYVIDKLRRLHQHYE